MEYTRGAGLVSRREVEAVGMTFLHPCWYLAAWCHLRGKYRTFRLDRIESLVATGRPHTVARHTPLAELMNSSNFKNHNTMKINSVEVKNLDTIDTIALPHVGDYSGIGAAFEKLAAWAGANNYWALGPRMIGIYHDDPCTVPVEKRRSSAALETKPGMTPGTGMSRYTVTGGKYLVMTAEVVMAEYSDAWMRSEPKSPNDIWNTTPATSMNSTSAASTPLRATTRRG
jgi:DNA gyrase inhibitor GyrI